MSEELRKYIEGRIAKLEREKEEIVSKAERLTMRGGSAYTMARSNAAKREAIIILIHREAFAKNSLLLGNSPLLLRIQMMFQL